MAAFEDVFPGYVDSKMDENPTVVENGTQYWDKAPPGFFDGHTPEEIAWITNKEDVRSVTELEGLTNKEKIMRILKLSSTEDMV